MNKLKVVVLVSRDPGDIYFANQLLKRLNVTGVLVEDQYTKTAGNFSLVKKIKKYAFNPSLFVKRLKNALYYDSYIKRSRRIAAEGFGIEGKELLPKASCKIHNTCCAGSLNEPASVELIKSLKPDVIAVCGTSILKAPVVSIPPKGTLNLHGGLSQHYRGVWTTMWAIYNEEPEYVGATVHYVSKGIDDGDIIFQGRPPISPDDNHESLYVKVVKLGSELMIRAISDIERGTVRSHKLKAKGRLYLSSRVTPEVIREVWRKVDAGVIRKYCAK
ncbi:MAG: formyl transferase [Deltaproteobacteria bacterium]|nr:formyl transferase [Deltaproteobacteria bacterium]